MPRLPHGINFTPEDVRDARKAVDDRIADVSLGFAMVKPVDLRRFDFLFLGLQDDPDNLLPESQDTVNALENLGKAMVETGEVGAPNDPDQDTSRDANFSAAFTYFGQFVDHDITLDADATPGTPPPAAKNLEPLPLEDIREQTKNLRTGVFELDSVYGDPAPKDPKDPRKLLIGKVSTLQNNENKPLRRPPETGPKKADENDLSPLTCNRGVLMPHLYKRLGNHWKRPRGFERRETEQEEESQPLQKTGRPRSLKDITKAKPRRAPWK